MRTLSFFSVVLVISTISVQCDGYRILGLFPLASKSHFIMFEALMKGLAQKGHQVDVISHFPLKKSYPNYTDIVTVPHFGMVFTNNLDYKHLSGMQQDLLAFLTHTAGNELCLHLGHPEVQEFIKNPPNDPPYDIVLTEYFVAGCYFAMGRHLNVPLVGVSTAALYSWLNAIIASPNNFAFVPNNLLSYAPPMSFIQRFHNVIYSVYHNLYYRYRTERVQEELIKKFYGPNMPSIREIEKDIALVLVNSHFSLNDPKPASASLIEVGGLHIEKNDEKLPKDLKEWFDSSNDGVIYFTFGSMVTIESFPDEMIQQMYRSFAKIAPIRVLMKVVATEKMPPGMPKNVRTFVWAPQLAALKHKNMKAFITHGGLMGTQEAIYCGVPMIAIPLFIDQFTNIDTYVKKNMAYKLDYKNITEENLDRAFNEILYNPIYSKSVKEISARFRDRPMGAMETAIWWVEYVVRHGNKTLRSAALDLSWWQLEMLDVYGCILLILALAIYLIFFLTRLFLKIIAAKINPKITNSKKID